MPDQPTIWDILSYEQDPRWETWDVETGRTVEHDPGFLARMTPEAWDEYYASQGLAQGERGGQEDMLSYLSDLLSESRGQDFDLHMFSNGSGIDLSIEDFLSDSPYGVGGDLSWLDMDEEELSAYLEEHSTPGWQLDEDSVGYLKALQEAFKAVPTSESFGLSKEIKGIETEGKRDVKSAYEGYIPGELLSRYGALQGKPGAQQKGEQLEQAYTEDIYGVQRGMGRDVRSTYEDFEDEWFSGVESWIGGLG